MNGMHAPFSTPGAIWQEHRTPAPENRIYYFNTVTKTTQWNKPQELMTSAERALEHQPWKEYELDGKKYWHNSETKESVWEMPEAFKQALGPSMTPATPAAPFAPPHGGHQSTQAGFGGYGGGPSRDNYRDRDRDHHRDHHRDHREPIGESRQIGYGNNGQVQTFVPANPDPEYPTPEEAEAAFIKLLRQCKVQPDWTWEQTVRVISKDAQYRAVKDPKDRKALFVKFCNDVIAQDKERAKERLTKLRADFATMLRSHPEIKYYTRWKTARPMIEGETIFRSTDDEAERRQLFVDYIAELKRANLEKRAALRKSATEGLINMLPKLKLDTYIGWEEAEGAIKNSPNFQLDEKYKTLGGYDILTACQAHIKQLEVTRNAIVQQERARKKRQQRKAREAYTALLQGLKKEGKIKAGTKWSRVRPLIENDDRYKAVVELPRPAGVDTCVAANIFFDIVEEEERALRTPRNEILDLIDDKRFNVTAQTTFEEFETFVKNEGPTLNIERDNLALIFERIQEKKVKRPAEDKHLDRHQRRAIEDLRSFMKRLDPPIAVTDTYDQTKARIAQSKEFLAVASEDDRQAAFEKHIRRLKEKEEEAKRDRERRQDRDNYRDRSERPHRNAGRSGRSRTPEQNQYEADRRKAIAERERNYRKGSMAEGLLPDRKPTDGHHDSARDNKDRDRERRDHRDRDREREREPRRERDRDHRDRERDAHRDRDRETHRDRDFDRRPRDENHYNRERRTREEDRERLYRRRVMDRDVDELPYGDERPTTSRRQRPADEEDQDRKEGGRHAAKRIKTETNSTREHTPHRDVPKSTITSPPAPAKDTKPIADKPTAHSERAGSEEGEIEED